MTRRTLSMMILLGLGMAVVSCLPHGPTRATPRRPTDSHEAPAHRHDGAREHSEQAGECCRVFPDGMWFETYELPGAVVVQRPGGTPYTTSHDWTTEEACPAHFASDNADPPSSHQPISNQIRTLLHPIHAPPRS